jgi:hypothetical protein
MRQALHGTLATFGADTLADLQGFLQSRLQGASFQKHRVAGTILDDRG